jgi:hypothetical protein
LRVAAAMAVGVAVFAACTGENLFTGPTIAGSLLGASVEITEPAEAAAIAVGDSVRVTAHVASENGISQVTFGGVFATGTTAFIQQVVSLSSPDTTISRFLKQAGTATGSAKIIVQAQDILGSQAADTVTVTIGS